VIFPEEFLYAHFCVRTSVGEALLTRITEITPVARNNDVSFEDSLNPVSVVALIATDYLSDQVPP
jgi:hypothetical protein